MAQSGIGSILNKNDEKFYIFKSKDLMKTWENYHALLNSNYHHNNYNNIRNNCIFYDYATILME